MNCKALYRRILLRHGEVRRQVPMHTTLYIKLSNFCTKYLFRQADVQVLFHEHSAVYIERRPRTIHLVLTLLAIGTIQQTSEVRQ